MDDGSGLKCLLADHLGSVVAVTNGGGTLLSQQRYLPFGEVRTDEFAPGSITQTDLAYTSQRGPAPSWARGAQWRHDAALRDLPNLGLMDYKARFYDPALGRFIQPDTIIPSLADPQSWNRYSYVMNDPLGMIDPSGNFGKCGDEGSYKCKIRQAKVTALEKQWKDEAEAERLIESLMKDPTDLVAGNRLLALIATYYNFQLAPGDHWQYEQMIVQLFGTDSFVGGYTPQHAGEPFWVPSNDLFGSWTEKYSDDSAVYISGELFGQGGCDGNLSCIATVMVHEATHSWVEYLVEQKYGENAPRETAVISANHELLADRMAASILGDRFGYARRHASGILRVCSTYGYSCGNPQRALEAFYGIDLSPLRRYISP